MKTIKTLAVLATLILGASLGRAQENFPIDPMYYKIFDKDSLKGFDESAARASALSEGFYGSEFKVKLYNLKKEYINNKYGLIKAAPYQTIENYLMANRPAAVPGCVNEDFEASAAGVITTSNQVNGWVVTHGYNNTPTGTLLTTYYPGWTGAAANSCNLITCCPMPPSVSEIIDCSAPGGYIDGDIGPQYPIYSVFGTGAPNTAASAVNPQMLNAMSGNKVLRLNDGISNYSIERLSKTFSVSAQNALFQFAFISVFATGHTCCDAGAFSIKLSNATTNQPITCPKFEVSVPSSQCLAGAGVPNYFLVRSTTTYTYDANGANTTGNIYNRWQINSMDLTAYIGQNITIDIIVSDCTGGAHFGKIYFDAQCGPMTVIGNGTVFDAGANVTIPTCGAAGATICAADGMGPYSWGGIGVPPAYTVPSMTNQCFVTSVSAQYTLYMQPAGSCAPIARVVNSTVTPAPLLNASVVQAQCGSTLAVISLTPSGSAANPSSLIWDPTPLSITANTLHGTYIIPGGMTPNTVSITATDPLGCKITTTVGVNPAPPIPSFTINNLTNSFSITCTNPVINLDAVTNYTYNNGTLNYFWASNSTTFSASNVNVNAAGTYTVVGTDPVTNCSIINQITIGVNTVVPVSSMSPNLQAITCAAPAQNVTVTASPTVNITHMIIAPQGGTFTANSPTAFYTPGGVGPYIYILKNDVNGCIAQKEFTVTSSDNFPTFTLLSPSTNFTLGCNTRSCAAVNINNPQTPGGGAASYTLLTPGASTFLPVGPLGQTLTYTTCAAGNYTAVMRNTTTGCETRVPVSILQNTFTPDINAVAERYILDCAHPTVTLKGISNTPNIEYSWTYQTNQLNTLLGDTITVSTNPSAPSNTLINTYNLVIVDLNSTCKSILPVPVMQNLYKPTAFITPETPSITCIKASVQLVISPLSATGIPTVVGFPFPHNQGVIASMWEGPSPQEPKYNSTFYQARVPGPYTMTATDMNNGCTTVATFTLIDNRKFPILTPSNSILDCGETFTTVAPSITDPVAGLIYSWTAPVGIQTGSTNVLKLTVFEPGEYSILVTNTVNGCSSGASMDVTNGKLSADFEADTYTGFAPLTVNFTNNSTSTKGNANVNSQWNFGNGTKATYSNVTTASAYYSQAGTYTVTLYATKGSCQETKQRVIKLDIPSSAVIPNVFTPNGDGTNDLFFIKATNLSDITAVIFDRWGHKVYEVSSTTGNIEWDGKNLQGKEAAEGTYFYSVKATGKDGMPYDKKGTISLFR